MYRRRPVHPLPLFRQCGRRLPSSGCTPRVRSQSRLLELKKKQKKNCRGIEPRLGQVGLGTPASSRVTRSPLSTLHILSNEPEAIHCPSGVSSCASCCGTTVSTGGAGGATEADGGATHASSNLETIVASGILIPSLRCVPLPFIVECSIDVAQTCLIASKAIPSVSGSSIPTSIDVRTSLHISNTQGTST